MSHKQSIEMPLTARTLPCAFLYSKHWFGHKYSNNDKRLRRHTYQLTSGVQVNANGQAIIMRLFVALTVAVSALLLVEAHPHGSNSEAENCAEQEYPTNIRVLMDSWSHQSLLSHDQYSLVSFSKACVCHCE